MATETIPVNALVGEATPTETTENTENTEVSVPQGNEFKVPEKYTGKEYLKDIDNYDKVFDLLDNSQSLIGKRPSGIPEETASQEDWDKFYGNMGRPEKAEDYAFELTELPEGLQRDETLLGQAKDEMHKIGLSNKQADSLQKWFDQYTVGAFNAKKEQGSNVEKEFTEMADKHFGDKKDQIMDNAKEILKGNVPESFKERLDNLNNTDLLMFAGILDNVKSKYITEDNLVSSGNVMSGALTPEESKTKRIELQKTPAYNDAFNADHDRIVKQVNDLYGN